MRTKLMKIATIGLFAVAMLLNVSVYFDANDSQNADLSLGNLKVTLFNRAYSCAFHDEICEGCFDHECYVYLGETGHWRIFFDEYIIGECPG